MTLVVISSSKLSTMDLDLTCHQYLGECPWRGKLINSDHI